MGAAWVVPVALWAISGLGRSETVVLANQQLSFRIGIWLLWLAFARPVALELISPPGSIWVRAAPIAVTQPILATSICALIIHIPIAILFSSSSDAMTGALRAAIAAGCLSLPLVSWRTYVAAAAGAACALGFMPNSIALATATLGFACGIRDAWLRAPEPSASFATPNLRLPAAMTWAFLCVIHVVRSEPIRIFRIGALLWVFWVLFMIWSGNDPASSLSESATRAAALEVVVAIVATTALLPSVSMFRTQTAGLTACTSNQSVARATIVPLLLVPAAFSAALTCAMRGSTAWGVVAALGAVPLCANLSVSHPAKQPMRAMVLALILGSALALSERYLSYAAACILMVGILVHTRSYR
jgi:hypothetical protein